MFGEIGVIFSDFKSAVYVFCSSIINFVKKVSSAILNSVKYLYLKSSGIAIFAMMAVSIILASEFFIVSALNLFFAGHVIAAASFIIPLSLCAIACVPLFNQLLRITGIADRARSLKQKGKHMSDYSLEGYAASLSSYSDVNLEVVLKLDLEVLKNSIEKIRAKTENLNAAINIFIKEKASARAKVDDFAVYYTFLQEYPVNELYNSWYEKNIMPHEYELNKINQDVIKLKKELFIKEEVQWSLIKKILNPFAYIKSKREITNCRAEILDALKSRDAAEHLYNLHIKDSDALFMKGFNTMYGDFKKQLQNMRITATQDNNSKIVVREIMPKELPEILLLSNTVGIFNDDGDWSCGLEMANANATYLIDSSIKSISEDLIYHKYVYENITNGMKNFDLALRLAKDHLKINDDYFKLYKEEVEINDDSFDSYDDSFNSYDDFLDSDHDELKENAYNLISFNNAKKRYEEASELYRQDSCELREKERNQAFINLKAVTQTCKRAYESLPVVFYRIFIDNFKKFMIEAEEHSSKGIEKLAKIDYKMFRFSTILLNTSKGRYSLPVQNDKTQDELKYLQPIYKKRIPLSCG